jgi:hypothetical protein
VQIKASYINSAYRYKQSAYSFFSLLGQENSTTDVTFTATLSTVSGKNTSIEFTLEGTATKRLNMWSAVKQ